MSEKQLPFPFAGQESTTTSNARWTDNIRSVKPGQRPIEYLYIPQDYYPSDEQQLDLFEWDEKWAHNLEKTYGIKVPYTTD